MQNKQLHPSPRRQVTNACALILMMLALLYARVAACANDRVALLIGNNNYPIASLKNPVNDSRDLGAVLRDLGFKTIVLENGSRQAMIDAIRQFGAQLDGAQVALFFYAGHAMQVAGANYLLPTDIDMQSEDDVTFSGVEVGQVMIRMARAKTRFNLVILDACRDNPFADRFRVSVSGLAQMGAPSGTLIAYATAPGSVARDGTGRNGVFTAQLLKHIKTPDIPVEIMFKRVREAVERDTKKAQTPWDSSSLKGDFVFNTTRSTAQATPSAGPSADGQLAIEREFWASARDSRRRADIQAYLDKYPNGHFVTLARSSLDALAQSGSEQVAATSIAPALTQPTDEGASRAPSMPHLPPVLASSPPAVGAANARAVVSPQPPQDPKSVLDTVTAAVAPSTWSTAETPRSRLPSSANPTNLAIPQSDLTVAPKMPEKESAPQYPEVVLQDGSRYRGPMKGKARHGSGSNVWPSGDTFEGNFFNDQPHGWGVYTFVSGVRYVGEMRNGEAWGHGKLVYTNGEVLEGEFVLGKLNGHGVYRFLNGDEEEGSYVESKLVGKVVYRFKNGDRYEGDSLDGSLTGQGVYTYLNGDRFEGRFVDGSPRQGVYYFTNGARYEGEMSEREITGHGTYYYKNGSKYQGELKKGNPNGKGVLWFSDGTRFEGIFSDRENAVGELVGAEGNRSNANLANGIVRKCPSLVCGKPPDS